MKKYLALATVTILFGTIEVAIRLLGQVIDPVLLASIRFLGAGVIMLPFCKIDLQKLSKSEILTLVFCAIFLTAAFIPYHKGVQIMPASSSSLIFGFNPAFAVFFALILLKEKLSAQIIIGIIAGIFGVYISTHGFTLPDFYENHGSIYMLFSAVFFGLYTAVAKKLLNKYSPISVVSIVFTLGGFLMLFFVQSFDFDTSLRSLSIIAYLVLAADKKQNLA